MFQEDRLIELENLFHSKSVLTMHEIKKTLQSTSKATIFRKLKRVGYIASYSHAGKYYTLDIIAKYNRYGPWSFEGMHFSRDGTLVNTLEILINRPSEGCFANELQKLVQIRVFNALTHLVLKGKVYREQISGEYFYISLTIGTDQLAKRKAAIIANRSQDEKITLPCYSDEIVNSFKNFLSGLNERQARLYLGLESMKLGYGGDKTISELTGVNVKTISKGRIELLNKEITLARMREVGAELPSIKKTEVIELLEGLMENGTAGDPIEKQKKHVRKNTRSLKDEFNKRGINICPTSVKNLLNELDYSLRVTVKQ